jgi:hypothetical protein
VFGTHALRLVGGGTQKKYEIGGSWFKPWKLTFAYKNNVLCIYGGSKNIYVHDSISNVLMFAKIKHMIPFLRF